MPLPALALGLGSTLLGDGLNALFKPGPKTTVTTGGSQRTEQLGLGGQGTDPYTAMALAREKQKAEIPGLMGQLNTNAAGQSGEAARQGFQNALGNLTNSAQAVNDASAMRQDADSLRNMGSTQGQLAMRSGQQTGARAISAMVEGMRNSRNPGAAAAAANSMAQNLGQSNTQMMQQAMSQGSQNLAQAGQMQGSSNNVLQSDLQNRNDIFVKPFYNSMQDIGNVMMGVNNAGNIAATTQSSTTMEQQKPGYMQGMQNLLGKLGGDAGAVGLYKGLFDKDPDKIVGDKVPIVDSSGNVVDSPGRITPTSLYDDTDRAYVDSGTGTMVPKDIMQTTVMQGTNTDPNAGLAQLAQAGRGAQAKRMQQLLQNPPVLPASKNVMNLLGMPNQSQGNPSPFDLLGQLGSLFQSTW